MFIGIGTPIPEIANLPGSSRPGGGGGAFEYTAIDNSYSMEFDRAAASYMTTGITVASGSDLTISLWIKGGTSGGFTNQMPFGIGLQGTSGNATAGRTWGNNFVMQTYDNTGANFGNRIVDTNIYDGNWYHIVFTRDNASGQYFAYVNGVNVQWIGAFGASNAPSITTDPAGDLYLGTADNNASYAWDGIIDEFAIWYGVLADTTIEAIYNATANNPGMVADLSETPEGIPTAWYRMGD
jgi:hypothetical protein